MLRDASGFTHIYIACGYTDLRRGIDGLAGIIKEQFGKDPFEAYIDYGYIYNHMPKRVDRIRLLHMLKKRKV